MLQVLLLQVRRPKVAGKFTRIVARDTAKIGKELTAIFEVAGIHIDWNESLLDAAAPVVMDFSTNNLTLAGCRNARRAGEVSILLENTALPGIRAGMLGLSFPCAAVGLDVAIFVDRCRNVAADQESL